MLFWSQKKESAACLSDHVPWEKLTLRCRVMCTFFGTWFCLYLHFLFVLDFDCMEPLGIESGEIPSDQISASSQYNPSWSSERSRLNNFENGWTPVEDSNKEWIQVCKSATYIEFIYVLKNKLGHCVTQVDHLTVHKGTRHRGEILDCYKHYKTT